MNLPVFGSILVIGNTLGRTVSLFLCIAFCLYSHPIFFTPSPSPSPSPSLPSSPPAAAVSDHGHPPIGSSTPTIPFLRLASARASNLSATTSAALSDGAHTSTFQSIITARITASATVFVLPVPGGPLMIKGLIGPLLGARMRSMAFTCRQFGSRGQGPGLRIQGLQCWVWGTGSRVGFLMSRLESFPAHSRATES